MIDMIINLLKLGPVRKRKVIEFWKEKFKEKQREKGKDNGFLGFGGGDAKMRQNVIVAAGKWKQSNGMDLCISLL